MPSDLVLDVPIAPEGALLRLAAAINQRQKRAFGVLKTQNEFVGAISERRFEVWERRQRAIHAVGETRPRRGGTRVEVRFLLSPVARVLLVLFAVLYVVVSAGIASQPPDPQISSSEVLIAALGAMVTAALFYGAAQRQRRDLADFLSAVFTGPVDRTPPPGRARGG